MLDHMLREFHEKQGQPIGHDGPLRTRVNGDERFLRLRLIISEAGELADAMGVDDRVEIADAIADLLYVVVGTGVTYGIPVFECLLEVQRSNMTKDAPASRAPGQKGGIKGPMFEMPRIKEILERHQNVHDRMLSIMHRHIENELRVTRKTNDAVNSNQARARTKIENKDVRSAARNKKERGAA